MAETNNKKSGSEEKTPSNECTDCPKETCLEFTVVDFWGDPVNPPSQYTLNGKSASPDTPITPLKAGEHTLKAVDGEEQAKAAMQRPYEPKSTTPSPAADKAKKEKKRYHKAVKGQIWESGVLLEAGCSNKKQPPCECLKHLIELDGSIDYCIVMAFLDNHSGGYHGSGHAGALIIDGESRMGTYTDITQHDTPVPTPTGESKTITLGFINIYAASAPLLSPDLKLNETALGAAFSYINHKYGSDIVSAKACKASTANGPDHADYSKGWSTTPAGFMINGSIAWAAYALPQGAYKKMLTYANVKQQEVAAARGKMENAYSLSSFNCMTYAVAVLDKGLGYLDRHPGKWGRADHPNDDIEGYMRAGSDDGIFDDRMYQGAQEAVSRQPQAETPGIRQRTRVGWVNSLEGDLVVQHAQPNVAPQ